MKKYIDDEMIAEMGIVKIQAQTILPATPQRTAERRLLDPTPLKNDIAGGYSA